MTVWMPQAQPSRSAMKVQANSIGSTADSSASRRCGISKRAGSPAPRQPATEDNPPASPDPAKHVFTDDDGARAVLASGTREGAGAYLEFRARRTSHEQSTVSQPASHLLSAV